MIHEVAPYDGSQILLQADLREMGEGEERRELDSSFWIQGLLVSKKTLCQELAH